MEVRVLFRALFFVFPLECNDASVPYGWHWKADASFDIPGIALAEAVSLGLLEDLLRQLVPPSFVTAMEGRFNAAAGKLRALPCNRHAKWTDPFPPPQSLDTHDGTHTLTATVKDSWQLGFWLLSQGPAIVVLKPAALRRRLISALTKNSPFSRPSTKLPNSAFPMSAA